MTLWNWVIIGVIVIFLLFSGITLASITKAAKKRDSFMHQYNPDTHPPDKKEEDDNQPKWW